MFQRTTALRDDLLGCDNPIKWLSIVTRLAKQYGYAYCTLMLLPKPSDRYFSQLVVVSNIPNTLLQCFDRLALAQNCPNYDKFAFSIQPRVWTPSDFDPEKPPQNKILEVLAANNIDCGVMFAVTSTTGERYILRMDGSGVELSYEEISELYMLSTIAFDHFQMLRRNSLTATKSLTKREIEVVKWTAQGKTSSEIAAILTLSDHTVNAYMTNAIKKLECVNRTQLVAKAIRLKLIT